MRIHASLSARACSDSVSESRRVDSKRLKRSNRIEKSSKKATLQAAAVIRKDDFFCTTNSGVLHLRVIFPQGDPSSPYLNHRYNRRIFLEESTQGPMVCSEIFPMCLLWVSLRSHRYGFENKKAGSNRQGGQPIVAFIPPLPTERNRRRQRRSEPDSEIGVVGRFVV